jgi:hypothetical protein
MVVVLGLGVTLGGGNPLKVSSYVPMPPRQEFQPDLLEFGKLAKPRYGFCCIDIFTKKGACAPIKKKTSELTAEAMMKCFTELGYPTSVMRDEGGSFRERLMSC